MLIKFILINHKIFFLLGKMKQWKVIIFWEFMFYHLLLTFQKKVSKWEISETSKYPQFENCSSFVILKDDLRSWKGRKKVQEGALWQTSNLVFSAT